MFSRAQVSSDFHQASYANLKASENIEKVNPARRFTGKTPNGRTRCSYTTLITIITKEIAMVMLIIAHAGANRATAAPFVDGRLVGLRAERAGRDRWTDRSGRA